METAISRVCLLGLQCKITSTLNVAFVRFCHTPPTPLMPFCPPGTLVLAV